MTLSQLISALYGRLEQLLSTAPRGAFSISGLLGLALLVYGYFQLRGNDNRGGNDRRRAQTQDPRQPAAEPRAQPAASNQAAQPTHPAAPSASNLSSAAQQQAHHAPCTPAGRAIAATLAGAKRVTLSLPGVLLLESSPSQLQESATVRPDAGELLRELAMLTDVYLIAHVADDVGEALATGALEAAGLLGSGPGQVRPHHVLCCSTLEGKVPIVRQLEPDLHIDGHAASVDELKRFLPRLLLVRPGGGAGGGAGGSSGNVGVANSLGEYFGL
ncbi:hypothetical protein GPECTOR_82g241 [Gonium pectorale]|uniref:Peroxisome biogenesis protein 22 n=1 Tax=Gonium pectorale TaxID=33097 RepID=A0A150G1I9_GONPE|nr:hypothetical protein GPECTOR_82g241 [Gonium pectorale]|eukprot:KXZ43707.1 hypothetical protein GPECTOR_82g241 [Gonium pectorale]